MTYWMENKMTINKHIINILLIIAVCCVVVLAFFTWRKITAPKNIFEEIYKVELQRAEKDQNTVLSGTEYFKAGKATKKEYEDEGGFSVSESPKSNSPYKLSIGSSASEGGLHRQESKNVNLNITYIYKDIKFSVQYIYLFDGGGGNPSVSGEGLHTSWEASKGEERISSYYSSYSDTKDLYMRTLKKWNVTDTEISSSMENELQSFLEVWFNSYGRSQFSKNNLGIYEQVE